jgi:HAMP domain-containing protein
MGGFFIILLLILLAHYWYVLVGGAVLYALWSMVIEPLREREAADRLRHERARQEIRAIGAATTLAMYQAARNESGVIEGTAEELPS